MQEAGTALYRLCRAFLKVFLRVYCRWEVSGREQVPESGGVLLIANHTSYSDPPLVGAACRRPVNFMAKAQLFEIPVLGWVIRRTHAFPVRRGAGDRGALRRAVKLLRAGKVLLIFPEGTRSSDGRLKELEIGAAFVALSARCQVVPVAIVGADRFLPRGKPVLLPAKVRVRFGAPLDLYRFDGRRPTREVLKEVSEEMAGAFRKLLPAERL